MDAVVERARFGLGHDLGLPRLGAQRVDDAKPRRRIIAVDGPRDADGVREDARATDRQEVGQDLFHSADSSAMPVNARSISGSTSLRPFLTAWVMSLRWKRNHTPESTANPPIA